MRAALHIAEGRRIRRDHAGSGAALDRHIADRHPPLHRQPADRRSPVLDHVAAAAVDPDPADDPERDVLSGHTQRQITLDGDGHVLGSALP